MSGGIVHNGWVRSSDGIDGWVGILFGGREEEGVSVAADDDVQVRDGCRDLFVLLVAGVSQGHDDVHPLVMEAGNLRLEGLDLVQDDEVLRVGDKLGVRGEVAHQPHGLLPHLELDTRHGEVGHLRHPGRVQVTHHYRATLVLEERDYSRYVIIKLVVAESDGVEVQQVVELGHNSPLELGVPDRSLEEVSSVEPQNILFCFPNFSDRRPQSGHTAVALAWHKELQRSVHRINFSPTCFSLGLFAGGGILIDLLHSHVDIIDVEQSKVIATDDGTEETHCQT